MSTVLVEQVTKRYGPVAALDALSFELPAGRLALVTGANGAGKSTLLRVLSTLTRPTRGRIALLGQDPFGSASASVRGRVAYLGPEPGLYAELTLQENLNFVAQVLGKGPDRVDSVISELGLGAYLGHRVRTLSLGFKRRAGLARVLLGEPDILLLDEPWNGLDANASAQLATTLERRRETGATTLVAAHAVSEYRALFDAHMHLEAGQLETSEGLSA